MESFAESFARVLKSPAFKLTVISGVIFVLLIPLFMVWALITEREGRAGEVRQSVASEWGRDQIISGPFLVVPYQVVRSRIEGDKRIEEMIEQRAVFLPETLNVDGKADTTILHRSIFDVTVYAGKLAVTGKFLSPRIEDVASDVKAVRWRDAVLVVAISDVSGLKTAATIKINAADTLAFEPSLGLPSVTGNGINVRLGSAPSLFAAVPDPATLPTFEFAFDLAINGSSELSFAPAARETRVALTSDWPHPSFSGAFLPAERTISSAGFRASWQIPHLARSVPQAFVLGSPSLDLLSPFSFGARFFVPLDFYDLTSRATKYALMFLVTAFMAMFLLEQRSAKAVHPVQYLFTGIALVFFFVLLLSLAEHLGFATAYAMAAAATGGMLSLYVARAQGSFAKGLVMLVVLAALYGLLFMILQLEDYALLAGALTGFVMLTVVMFATLKVDWSGRGGTESTSRPTL